MYLRMYLYYGKLHSNENEKTRAVCINMDKFYSVGSEEAVVEEYSPTVYYLYKCYLKCQNTTVCCSGIFMYD